MGRSRLSGRIGKPAVHWRHFCGSRETYLAVRIEDDQRSTISLPAADLNSDQWEALAVRWRIHGPWYDLDGDGQRVSIPPDTDHKIGAFLPDHPGLQKVEFESAFDSSGGTAAKAHSEPIYGRLMARENGQWVEAWRSRPLPILFIANVIVGDFDHDGHLEVAVTPWYDLHVLDMATGRRKYKARFKPPRAKSGRAYGWIGAFDLNQSGKDEFIILADFENHMEVLGWKGGRFCRLWCRVIEPGIRRKTTILRPGINPVQDIDGDGNLEIIISLFDATGDGQWHIVVLDGMTGRTVLDMPEQYLSGMYDVDGDGIAELFCTATSGPLVPAPSRLSILSLKGREISLLWQTGEASFQNYQISDFPLNVNSGSGTGRETVLVGPLGSKRGLTFFTRRITEPATDQVELTVWKVGSGSSVRRVSTLTGSHLEAVATLAEEEGKLVFLVRSQVDHGGQGEIVCCGAVCQPLLSRRTDMPPATVVVGKLTPGAMPTVIAQGAGETLQAFRPGVAGRRSEVIWRTRGRVAASRPAEVLEGGVVLADLNGDGQLATIAANALGAAGCARLVAIAPDGEELWHHDFEHFPGPLPPWNVGGLTYFFAGHFRDRRRCDVLVSLRRNTMHSDETFLLDGRTGERIWHRTKGGCGLGCGGGWVAIFDYDGDGLDDALTFYPHVIFVMRGRTGELLVDRMAHKVFGVPSFYAKPVVADFLGNGKRQFLYSGTAYNLGLLDADLNVIWQGRPASGTPAIMQGIGDVDGDGRLELLSPGHRRAPGSLAQDFHCYDASNGELKWRLPLPGSCFIGNNRGFDDSPGTPAVADIDGDGRDECVFAILNSLYAVGSTQDGREGQVRWTLELPGRLGTPTIADLGLPRGLQVVVACADGYVYGIGPDDAEAQR